jgi:serine/threonine-protein kinase
MELVTGETLAERIGKGALRTEEALSVGGQIAEALEAAHKQGVVHRDLKPANVKITPEGRVKVLDFGLAKTLDRAEVEPSQRVTLSQAGFILGTPAYMSPEQARGEPLDCRTYLAPSSKRSQHRHRA